MQINLSFNGYQELRNFCIQIIGKTEEKKEEPLATQIVEIKDLNDSEKKTTEIINRAEEKKEAKTQKYGNNKPKYDVGKILALHRAGWSGAKIADEMGCSTATVSHYIKESRHAGT